MDGHPTLLGGALGDRADYLAVLEGLEIPDRGPRGSPGNYAIVEKVGSALHKKRLAMLAATG